MANNFRIAGGHYVSKAGHDSNDGLTPDSPKKSLGLTPTGIKVVGTGLYLFTGNIVSAVNNQVVGDGHVIVDYQNTAGQLHGSGENTYKNLTIRNCSLLQLGRNYADKCIFLNCNYNGNNSIDEDWTNNIHVNCVQTAGVSFPNRHFRSIFINTVFALKNASSQVFVDSYVDFASSVGLGNAITPTNFSNNNVQGTIVLEGIYYAIQDQFTGTPQDNGYAADVYWLNEANLTANGYTGTIAGWDAAVATCINRDPKFNNASKLDFTLQADSPHIGRASDGFSNIGGTEYAQSFYAGISNPNILLFEASEAIDTATNNNDWRLKPGYNEGWIRAIVKVSNNDVQISSIPYIGNYAFDSDQAGGSPTNMNVPDSKPTTNEYPDYLTVTTQAANDTTLIIAGHGAVVGEWLWVDGQYREITGVPDADTITFATSLRAIVTVGTVVKIGTFEALASLSPNRLNMKMRSSKLSDVNASNWDNPLTWDNDGLAPAGQYMAQEWNNAPMIDSLNEVGFGDDNYDANYGNPINLKVVDIMIYLRNNYRS